jgi:3-oxo-5-alpha-steroid 4-dehydrogenase 1
MHFFQFLLFAWIAIPLIIFPILLKVRAPYGRHTKSGWGPMIDNHWGWFWMEVPALLTFPMLAAFGPAEKDLLSWILIVLWVCHYFNRVFLFPFRLKTKGKKMPLVIALSAVIFNIINGFVNGYYIGFIDGSSGNVLHVFAIIGAILFVTGFAINNMADSKLIKLRKANNGYQIPRGWLLSILVVPTTLARS